MPVFEHDTGRLYYLIRGNGAPVVLIHGLGATAAEWAFQVPALESRFQVIVPDLPGCGHSLPRPARYEIPELARSLWQLLDALGVGAPNLVGFSLGGAVALQMALQRPAAVPRLVLINSLATYRTDHWIKWLEAHGTALLVRLLGMRRTGRLVAARLFPLPAQRAMRERCANVIGSAEPATYLDMAFALARWSVVDQLARVTSRTLVITAQRDYTPLAEKFELAAGLRGDIVVVRGSRHGTPFDAIGATNASLLAHLCDAPLPGQALHTLDAPDEVFTAPPSGSIVEDHAAAL